MRLFGFDLIICLNAFTYKVMEVYGGSVLIQDNATFATYAAKQKISFTRNVGGKCLF